MQKIDTLGAPLCCVIRKDAELEGNLPALAEEQPHTKKHGLVQADMVAFTPMTICTSVKTA